MMRLLSRVKRDALRPWNVATYINGFEQLAIALYSTSYLGQWEQPIINN